jgi:hypothetical protein
MDLGVPICDYDVQEARSLLNDYRAALPRCLNGELLKQELVKLNLRAFALGLCLNPESVLCDRFQQVVATTSERFEQGGIYAHRKEAQNIRHWIGLLTELANPTPDLLACIPFSRAHPLL